MEATGRRAIELATGSAPGSVATLATGMSSSAYVANVDGREWVARVPIAGSDRRIAYHAEAALGRALTDGAQPVARWTVVDVDGITCSVARRLDGRPVESESEWSAGFARQVGALLHTLHRLPASGFGPLADDPHALRGICDRRIDGLLRRWDRAPMWPFDDSELDRHAVATEAPDLVPSLGNLRGRIVGAERGQAGVVHSDLHRQHLLVDDDGGLAGVLDFGDAFVGSTAWDLALVCWYYGDRNARLVADHCDGGPDFLTRARLLAVAVGLYKLAKQPSDRSIVPRVRRRLDTVTGT